jgi:hypothetical protein
MDHKNQTIRFDDLDHIPPHIMEKAVEISRFMQQRGHVTWALGDLCSRNHVDKLKVYEDYFEFKQNQINFKSELKT